MSKSRLGLLHVRVYYTCANSSFACLFFALACSLESKPPASHPFFLGFLPLALFRLPNINHCFLFSRISPISYPSRTPTFRLFLSHFPYPSCPLLSRHSTPPPLPSVTKRVCSLSSGWSIFWFSCCVFFKFEMCPEDDPDHPIIASSATACHCVVLKAVNKAR